MVVKRRLTKGRMKFRETVLCVKELRQEQSSLDPEIFRTTG